MLGDDADNPTHIFAQPRFGCRIPEVEMHDGKSRAAP